MSSPVMSPAACRYLRIKVEMCGKHLVGGAYCSHLQQFIVHGQRGTCIGCENFAEPTPDCSYSEARLS